MPPRLLAVTISPWVLLFIYDSLGSRRSAEKGWSAARRDQSASGKRRAQLTRYRLQLQQAGLSHRRLGGQ